MVQFDYFETMMKVRGIRELADNLRRMVSELDSLMTDTSVHWRGMAASAYLKQCEQLKAEMDRSRQDLVNIADTVQKVAETIKDADQRLADLASTTTSIGL
ncbi:MAG: WXG100 family type VII secretion target [Clostridiales bacterium]|jgi:WXG100 family type VII secretion target|nr:WXG100 family type VII secretion target [Clostridiales bacterium]MDR2751993.1 WXG100 family type VII secretion target [Clostridiales bacterium]